MADEEASLVVNSCGCLAGKRQQIYSGLRQQRGQINFNNGSRHGQVFAEAYTLVAAGHNKHRKKKEEEEERNSKPNLVVVFYMLLNLLLLCF